MAGLDKVNFDLRRPKLIIVKAFEEFTCYYDPTDSTFWFWNGTDFIGKGIEELYEDLMEMV
jgi:hypothetical protein